MVKNSKSSACCDTKTCNGGVCADICPIILFLVAFLWLVSDAGIFVLNIPWLPLLVTLFMLKMLVKKYSC